MLEVIDLAPPRRAQMVFGCLWPCDFGRNSNLAPCLRCHGQWALEEKTSLERQSERITIACVQVKLPLKGVQRCPVWLSRLCPRLPGYGATNAAYIRTKTGRLEASACVATKRERARVFQSAESRGRRRGRILHPPGRRLAAGTLLGWKWVGKSKAARLSSRRLRRTTLSLSLHTHKCVTRQMPLTYNQNRQTGSECMCCNEARTRSGIPVRRKSGPAPGAHSAPARRPLPPITGTQQELLGHPHKVVAGGVRSVLDVAGRVGEDGEDGVDGEADPGPAHLHRLREVVAGDGIGDVGLGRDPPKVGAPAVPRRSRPKRRKEAVDGWVLPVPFEQGTLAGDVVDVRQPVLREARAEGQQGRSCATASVVSGQSVAAARALAIAVEADMDEVALVTLLASLLGVVAVTNGLAFWSAASGLALVTLAFLALILALRRLLL